MKQLPLEHESSSDVYCFTGKSVAPTAYSIKCGPAGTTNSYYDDEGRPVTTEVIQNDDGSVSLVTSIVAAEDEDLKKTDVLIQTGYQSEETETLEVLNTSSEHITESQDQVVVEKGHFEDGREIIDDVKVSTCDGEHY